MDYIELEPLKEPVNILSDREKLLDLFDRYDVNEDGRLSKEELQRLLEEAAVDVGVVIPSHIQKAIFRKADKNGDEKLDKEEFIAMLQDPMNIRMFAKKWLNPMNMMQDYLNVVGKKKKEEDSYAKHCCSSFPIFIPLILLVDSGCFFLMPPNIQKHLVYDPSRRTEVWRFITYGVLHSGLPHFLANVIVQTILGVLLEIVHGRHGVALVYIASVLAGGLGHSVLSEDKLVGASGGVYGLITAHMATVIMNWSEMKCGWMYFVLFSIYTVCDLTTTYTQGQKDVSFWNHFFGAIGGLLIGLIALRNFTVKKYERNLQTYALVLYVVMIAILIILNIWTIVKH